MFSVLRKRLACFAVFACMLVLGGPIAMAATVSYTTLGSFDGVTFTSSASETLSNANNSVTIDFTGSTVANQLLVSYPNFTSYSLGSLNVTPTSDGGGTLDFDFSTNFYLKVIQTNPTNGSAVASSIISGTIYTDTPAGGTTKVVFTPSTAPFTIDYVQYSPAPMEFDLNTPGPSREITARVQAVPVPAAAAMGLPLLGLLGGATWLRRRRLMA